MKTAILVLTDQGLATALKIINSWTNDELPELWVHEKCDKNTAQLKHEALKPETLNLLGVNLQELDTRVKYFIKLKDILPDLWDSSSALIFIMATGIVVRHIAPYIERKDKDPAVLVLDEKGDYVIPLLSGHLGGANAWAKVIAQELKAHAVITTATDVRGLTAPDEYARQLGWKVKPLSKLPEVNRFLLDKGYLKVWSDGELSPDNPILKDKHYHFLSEEDKGKANFWISYRNYLDDNKEQIESFPLLLLPRNLSVGVGARRGVSKEQVLKAIMDSLNMINVSRYCIKGLYSVDVKANEGGIIEAAKELGVPFQTFPKELVQRVNEEKALSSSNFVKEKIGVDGVCEATSLLGTTEGILLLPKQKLNGVTIAISREKYM